MAAEEAEERKESRRDSMSLDMEDEPQVRSILEEKKGTLPEASDSLYSHLALDSKEALEKQAMEDRFGKELNDSAPRWRKKEFLENLPILDYETPREFLPIPIEPADIDIDKDLDLYVNDIDYATAKPGPWEGKSETCSRVPVMRAYCSTLKGQDLLVYLHGFKPYMYTRIPMDLVDPVWAKAVDALPKGCLDAPPATLAMNQLCESFAEELELRLRDGASTSDNKSINQYIVSVEPVVRESMFYYRFGKLAPFFKITVCLPKVIAMTRTICMKGNKKTLAFAPPPSPPPLLSLPFFYNLE